MFKAISSHVRDMCVLGFPNRVVYSIPLYSERRDLGKLLTIKVKEHEIELVFERDLERLRASKEDEEITLK